MTMKTFSRLVFLFGLGTCALAVPAQSGKEAPFSALRFGYRYAHPDEWPGMCKALKKNVGAFDEVWFSTGVSFPPMSWH